VHGMVSLIKITETSDCNRPWEYRRLSLEFINFDFRNFKKHSLFKGWIVGKYCSPITLLLRSNIEFMADFLLN
jgi:hypothetical protein